MSNKSGKVSRAERRTIVSARRDAKRFGNSETTKYLGNAKRVGMNRTTSGK